MHNDNFIRVDPEKSELKKVHHLLIGGVAPRPIAFVSTISKNGINNLSPFSFFNAFGANPPYVAFSPALSGKDGSAKDTLVNIQEIPECVVQVVPYSLVEQASHSSTSYPPEVDEFVKSGLTPIDSEKVRPKRVKESPLQMECNVEQIIPLGGTNGSGNLVLCRVILFHVKEDIYKDNQIHPQAIDLAGRNSGNFYTRASGSAIFEVIKPRGTGMGIDQLPDHIKTSKMLSGHHLAQLGGLPELPSKESTQQFLEEMKSLDVNAEAYKNDFKAFISHHTTENNTVEKIAIKALEANDAEFALKMLMATSS